MERLLDGERDRYLSIYSLHQSRILKLPKVSTLIIKNSAMSELHMPTIAEHFSMIVGLKPEQNRG
jgi:hypothetical protein